MPQDGRKSAVYRPFVRCNDPKGVADCGTTIKKSKADPLKMKNMIESEANPRDLYTSSSFREVREGIGSGKIRDKLQNPSSYQLLEVSRGADKLNDAIGSFSRGLSFDMGTKDVAKDLLKGALDLQESLLMLGKLQKASQYMSNLKKKQKKKPSKERVDEGMEELRAAQFKGSIDHMGFQNPRLSADGCSRNSFEELRKVIRDGLARQNLLQDSDSEEDAYFPPRNLDLTSDVATTSSGWSSKDRSKDSAPTGYLRSKVPPFLQKKAAAGPNLIARLMGLEDLPTKSRDSPRRHSDCGNIMNQKKSLSTVDMARKSHFADKVETGPWVITDELGTGEDKVVQRNNSMGGLMSRIHRRSSSFDSKERPSDVAPPIVIMKPLNLHSAHASNVYPPTVIGEDEYLTAKEVLRKLRQPNEVSNNAGDCEGGSSNFNSKHRRGRSEETSRKRAVQEERTDDWKEMVVKSEIKEVIANSEIKEVIVKSEVKEVKTKERISDNGKASVPISLELEKGDADARDSRKDQKKAPSGRRKIIQELKPNTVVRAQDQTGAVPRKLRRPENRTSKTKNQPQKQKDTDLHTSEPSTQTVLHDIEDQKNSQPEEIHSVMKFEGANSICERVECKDEATRINPPCSTDSIMILTGAKDAEQSIDKFEISIAVDHADGEVTVPTPAPQKVSNFAEEDIHHRLIARRNSSSRASMKALLLSSPSFLNHAEEVFDLNMNQLISLQAYTIKEFSPKLSLECCHEILDRKSLRDSQGFDPLLQACTRNCFRTSIPLDHLLDEVCDELEDLKTYNTLDNENLPSISIYTVFERDIRGKGVASGMWDVGWKNEFSVDDVELVVGDMDKLILSNMIEELLKDSW